MISIVNQPTLYTPVNNPNIFELTSDNPFVAYFLVQVLTTDDQVIAKQKYYSLPNYKTASATGTYFDLSSILTNVVDTQLVNTSVIVEPTPESFKAYKLRITEYKNELIITQVGGITLTSPTGKIVAGDSVNSGIYNVWSGVVNPIQFSGYSYRNFVINTISNNTQFLTRKPLVNNVYRNSTEYLYLLNNTPDSQVRIRFYAAGGMQLGSHVINLPSTKAVRLNVSPDALSVYFGGTFNNLYGDEFTNVFTSEFGSYADPLSSNYYTIRIVGANGIRSEERTYILKDQKGCRQSFQLLFSNPLGGFDTLDLFNPKETITASKTSINKYGYKFNNGTFSNLNNGVFNATSSVINSNSISSYKAVSDVLSDSQIKWVRSIISAEKVCLKLANGTLLPVSLSTNSYNIQSKRYSTNNNRLELEFTSDISGLFD
jgi:hypothetical protein